MRGISRRSKPIKVVVHYPKTEEGKQELARRAASVHAALVNATIQKLNCPTAQKNKLLDAVIASSRKQMERDCR